MINMNLLNELLRKRETLQAISQITFNFSTLNKRYPVDQISEADARELVGQYHLLIQKIKVVIEEYETESGGENGKLD